MLEAIQSYRHLMHQQSFPTEDHQGFVARGKTAKQKSMMSRPSGRIDKHLLISLRRSAIVAVLAGVVLIGLDGFPFSNYYGIAALEVQSNLTP